MKILNFRERGKVPPQKSERKEEKLWFGKGVLSNKLGGNSDVCSRSPPCFFSTMGLGIREISLCNGTLENNFLGKVGHLLNCNGGVIKNKVFL